MAVIRWRRSAWRGNSVLSGLGGGRGRLEGEWDRRPVVRAELITEDHPRRGCGKGRISSAVVSPWDHFCPTPRNVWHFPASIGERPGTMLPILRGTCPHEEEGASPTATALRRLSHGRLRRALPAPSAALACLPPPRLKSAARRLTHTRTVTSKNKAVFILQGTDSAIIFS